MRKSSISPDNFNSSSGIIEAGCNALEKLNALKTALPEQTYDMLEPTYIWAELENCPPDTVRGHLGDRICQTVSQFHKKQASRGSSTELMLNKEKVDQFLDMKLHKPDERNAEQSIWSLCEERFNEMDGGKMTKNHSALIGDAKSSLEALSTAIENHRQAGQRVR